MALLSQFDRGCPLVGNTGTGEYGDRRDVHRFLLTTGDACRSRALNAGTDGTFTISYLRLGKGDCVSVHFPGSNPVRNHAQRQRLYGRFGLVSGCAVSHNSRQLGDFGNPPPVVFSVRPNAGTDGTFTISYLRLGKSDCVSVHFPGSNPSISTGGWPTFAPPRQRLPHPSRFSKGGSHGTQTRPFQ